MPNPRFRFRLAVQYLYNAALQLASAALIAAGYRAERGNHHFRVIHSLEFTIGADAAIVRKFDVFRKKRNISDYERANTISEIEAEEMQELAETLRKSVDAWLRRNHPQLTP